MIGDLPDEMLNEQMPDDSKAYLWCVGMLHELEDRGLVESEAGDRLSPKGIAIFDQLKASGWLPQKEMALAALTELTGSTNVAEMTWAMIERLSES